MRGKVKNRIYPVADSVYNSETVSKFINQLMKDGKKSVAQKVVYDTFDEIKERTKKDPLEVFNTALRNVGPTVEVRSRRVGGANYQVPREVRADRRETLAMRWILEIAQKQSGRPMFMRLADDLIAASNNEGEAIKKRENVHKMAEANKAFAHFSW
jgi:small subunit ribosomal protein S7